MGSDNLGAMKIKIKVPTDAISTAGRSAEDLALGALIGGNLFGRVAMHPALADVSDQAERGKVLNRAWRRYGNVESLALATLVAQWLPARRNRRSLCPREQRLMLAKDVALSTLVVTGLATAACGVGFAQQAPGGAVPMKSGFDTSPEAPARAATMKHIVNALSAINLAAGVAVVAVDSALTQAHLRQAPLRKLLRGLTELGVLVRKLSPGAK
jgi:hypothetical protein